MSKTKLSLYRISLAFKNFIKRLSMSPSIILLILAKNKIGRQFLQLILSSFLKIGITFTIFRLVGKISVTLIDKTQASESTKREYFWMKTLKTYHPYPLNIEKTY